MRGMIFSVVLLAVLLTGCGGRLETPVAPSGCWKIQTSKSEVIRIEIPCTPKPKHRPTKCAVYYNDGTDRWKDCMGVGLK